MNKRDNRPVLITDAPINLDDEWDRRRKRYLITMIVRALCIIAAASTYTISGWLAAAFMVGGIVLPWTAVVMANDRPPKEGVRFRRFFGGHDNSAQNLGRTNAKELEQAPQTEFESSETDEGGAHPFIDL